ncbi:hypothetical protein T265_10212 [Opisthorchis viverrini]|uniref:Uncharacterized protein n=1 Tax=Opisthorchis viverrini TaxID=6198 RepID=A0A074Z391_OPIVI|nr:hypothetical protein T265_10212 [Opisthorchis viverrini]KER21478.1 hypothetical protein T265_10212 [Opisthorchis viverrini]
MDQKPDRCAPRTSKDSQCLTIDVFGVLLESGWNTGSAILNAPNKPDNNKQATPLWYRSLESKNHQKLRWLGHILPMPFAGKRFSLVKIKVADAGEGQPLTWHTGMKEITKHLPAVGATRRSG